MIESILFIYNNLLLSEDSVTLNKINMTASLAIKYPYLNNFCFWFTRKILCFSVHIRLIECIFTLYINNFTSEVIDNYPISLFPYGIIFFFWYLFDASNTSFLVGTYNFVLCLLIYFYIHFFIAFLRLFIRIVTLCSS